MLNLAHDTVGWERAAEQLDRLGWPYRRFDAVYGAELPVDLLERHAAESRRRGWNLTPTQIGRYVSNLRIWETVAADKSLPGAFVSGDDFAEREGLLEVMESLVALDLTHPTIIKLSDEYTHSATYFDCRKLTATGVPSDGAVSGPVYHHGLLHQPGRSTDAFGAASGVPKCGGHGHTLLQGNGRGCARGQAGAATARSRPHRDQRDGRYRRRGRSPAKRPLWLRMSYNRAQWFFYLELSSLLFPPRKLPRQRKTRAARWSDVGGPRRAWHRPIRFRQFCRPLFLRADHRRHGSLLGLNFRCRGRYS